MVHVKMVVASCRSVSYTINRFYKNHVTVTAEVVPVGLELSTENLILKPSPGLPSEAGEYVHLAQVKLCTCALW